MAITAMKDEERLVADRLGIFINWLCDEHGWSQARVGEALCLSQVTISQLKNGRGSRVFLSTAMAAQRKLGLDPLYFFDPVLKGDGTHMSYLASSSVVSPGRERRPAVPAANANTGYEYTEDHETPAGAQHRREREASARVAEMRKKKAPGKIH